MEELSYLFEFDSLLSVCCLAAAAAAAGVGVDVLIGLTWDLLYRAGTALDAPVGYAVCFSSRCADGECPVLDKCSCVYNVDDQCV